MSTTGHPPEKYPTRAVVLAFTASLLLFALLGGLSAKFGPTLMEQMMHQPVRTFSTDRPFVLLMLFCAIAPFVVSHLFFRFLLRRIEASRTREA